MNISVIGTGYVGLITGTCLAELGLNVFCIDTNKDKINKLKEYEIPIYEPGLEDLVKNNVLKCRLHFTTDLREAVDNSDAIFVCVGTPSKKDGSVDLKSVYKVANDIACCIESYKLIVIKSTVPIGTCRHIKKIINDVLKEMHKDISFDIVSNPEFLKEGSAVHDFNYPDRIVIGTENDEVAELMRQIYSVPIFENTPFVFTKIETSEMIKYASNAFLATKISYINEIANICELCGADISIVAKAVGLDKRIGDKFLNPGPGFGGSCFPKDVKALIKIAKNLGYKPLVIESVIKSNMLQIKHALSKIKKIVLEVKDKNFTVLGLAFKEGTDDIRDSPSLSIIKELIKLGGNVCVYDPKAIENTKILYPMLNIKYCEDEYSACLKSDCIIIATEWAQFQNLDYVEIKKTMNTPIIIDLKNILNMNTIKDLGFIYKGVGK